MKGTFFALARRVLRFSAWLQASQPAIVEKINSELLYKIQPKRVGLQQVYQVVNRATGRVALTCCTKEQAQEQAIKLDRFLCRRLVNDHSIAKFQERVA